MKIKLITTVTLFSIAIFLIFASFFRSTFPYTHDGENHLARFANYKIAIREGQIPPRFAPNLMNHYGYPVFNYNYPLANIASLPFSFLKTNYTTTFKIITFFAVLSGAVGVYLYLKKLKFSELSSFFSSLVFIITPYIVTNIFFRGSIGEVLAISIFPWLLWSVELLRKKSKDISNVLIVATLFSTFLLSHNISVLFGVPMVLIYALTRYREKRQLLNLTKSIAISIALTLWFWLPALLEKDLVVVGSSTNQNEFASHFISLNQLLFSSISFGFSYFGSIDGISFSIGLLQIISLLILLAIFINKLLYSRVKDREIYIPTVVTTSFIFVVVITLFQFEITKPIWTVVPFANFIQFPWRLASFSAVFIMPICAFVYQTSLKYIQYFLFSVLILLMLLTTKLKPVDQIYKTNIDFDAYPQSTSTLNENLPVGFSYLEIGDWQPAPLISTGSGDITVQKWNGTTKKYVIKNEEKVLVIEPTMYFAGWESKDNGEELSYVFDDTTQGRIAFILKPGSHEIETKFTQNTFARMIGNIVSVLTLVGLSFYLVRVFRKRGDKE